MSPLPRRLNARIILTVSLVLLATGVTSGWLTARSQTASLLAAMRLNSSIMVRNFADSCARYLLVEDYAELESFLLKSAELPDIRRLQVCDAGGALLWEIERNSTGQPQAKSGITRLKPPMSRTMEIASENDLLVIWHPIMAGSVLGWLKAEFSLSAIQHAQARIWESTLYLTMAWVCGSALLIILLLRPIVRSISGLTTFATRLDENKGSQITITGQPLEIAALGAALNETSTKLFSTEHQLLDEQERLRKSETLYRSVVTSMAEGICLQQSSGEISAVNPAAEIIEGRSSDQMLGRTSDDPQRGSIYEDGRPFLGELHPAMVTLRSGEPQTDVVMGIHRPDGSLIWISVNSQPLTAPGDTRPYAVVTTFHDITGRKLAEEELVKHREHLEELVKERTSELAAKNAELQKINKLFVGRELRMIELKDRIRELEEKMKGDLDFR